MLLVLSNRCCSMVGLLKESRKERPRRSRTGVRLNAPMPVSERLACSLLYAGCEVARSGLQEAQLLGPGDGLDAATDPQLAINVAGMLFDRRHRDHQFLCDLAVGEAPGDEVQHL
jgi:hypothetical protein